MEFILSKEQQEEYEDLKLRNDNNDYSLDIEESYRFDTLEECLVVLEELEDIYNKVTSWDLSIEDGYYKLYDVIYNHEDLFRCSSIEDTIRENVFDEDTVLNIFKDDIEANDISLARIHYFIQGIRDFDTNLYLMDGYGNLHNFKRENLEDKIDLFLEEIQRI